MPYVTQEARERLSRTGEPLTAGELNYVVTAIVDAYVTRQGLSYDTVNEVVGVLECAKLEAYRRIAAPYEDAKCAANGDVYAGMYPALPAAIALGPGNEVRARTTEDPWPNA